MSEQECFLTHFNKPGIHHGGNGSFPTALCICGSEFVGFDYEDIKKKLCDHFSVEDFSDPMDLGTAA